MAEQKFILIRGICGSGKSTFAKQLVEYYHCLYNNATHLEADQFFEDADGNYNWNPELLYAAHKWCQSSTYEALKKGNTVVVSNTFTTKKELKPYFEIAKEFNIIPVVILCENQFGNVHNVPEETLEKMRSRFQYDITDLFL